MPIVDSVPGTEPTTSTPPSGGRMVDAPPGGSTQANPHMVDRIPGLPDPAPVPATYAAGKTDWAAMPMPDDVWHTDLPSPAVQFQPLLHRITAAERVPYELARRVMGAESSGGTSPNLWEPNEAGAVGPFQVKAGTALMMGVDNKAFVTPEGNIRAGVRYLRMLLDATGGDWAKTVQLYHDGQNADVLHPSKAATNEVSRVMGTAGPPKTLGPTGMQGVLGSTGPLPPQALPPGGMQAVLNQKRQQLAQARPPAGIPPPQPGGPQQPAHPQEAAANPLGTGAEAIMAVKPIAREVFGALSNVAGQPVSWAGHAANWAWDKFTGIEGYANETVQGLFNVVETGARANYEYNAQAGESLLRIRDRIAGGDPKGAISELADHWLSGKIGGELPIPVYSPSTDELGKIIHSAATPEEGDAVLDRLIETNNKLMGIDHLVGDISHENGILLAFQRLTNGIAYDPTTYVDPAMAFKLGGAVVKVVSDAKFSEAAVAQSLKVLSLTSGTKLEGPALRGQAQFQNVVDQIQKGMKLGNRVTSDVGKSIAHGWERFVTNISPHLDEFFGPRGKLIYMSTASKVRDVSTDIERKFVNMYAPARQTIRDTGQITGQISQHELQQMWRYGSAGDRAVASSMGYIEQEDDKLFHDIGNNGQGFLVYTKHRMNAPLGGDNVIPDYYIGRGKAAAKWVQDAGGDMGRAMKAYQLVPEAFKIGMTDFSGVLTKVNAKLSRIGERTMKADDLVWARSALQRWALGKSMLANSMADFVHMSEHPEDLMHLPKGGFGSRDDTAVKIFHIPPSSSAVKIRNWERGIQAGRKTNKPPPDYLVSTMRTFRSGARRLGEWYKRGIQINPFPHGLWNVGIITAARGGVGTAIKGLGYGMQLLADELGSAQARLNMRVGQSYGAATMGGGGISARLQEGINLLHAAGGHQSYWRSGMLSNRMPDALQKIPGMSTALRGLGNGYKAYFNAVSKTLDHLETGYRVAYMEHLNAIHGVPKTAEEVALRGAQVLNDIGNYHDTSLLVQWLQALGGVFTTFHVGIAPKAIYNDLLHNSLTSANHRIPLTPQLMRLQNLINEEQVVPGYDVEQGGPVGAAAGVLSPKSLASQAVVGPIAHPLLNMTGQAVSGHADPMNLMAGAKGIAESTIPAYAMLDRIPGVGDALRPYPEPATLPPWMAMLSIFTTIYEQKQKNPYVVKRTESTFWKADELMNSVPPLEELTPAGPVASPSP